MTYALSVSEKQTGKRRDYMSNTKKPDPERPDEDNPEWTREDMAKARPATEVLPGLIGAAATEELLRRSKGRPPKEHPKVNQTIRIDPDVLAAYRRQGKGWQTLINEVLRQNMPRHQK
jgi:uncharacterized protein (DUF4415 family)